MELLSNVTQQLFAVDSIWNVILRGVLWLAISLVIIISTDQPSAIQSTKKLKSNLGLFLLFLITSTSLIYLLFGFTTT